MKPAPAPRGTSAEGNLHAARVAWNTLANPARWTDWPAARVAYNRAVSLAFEDLRRSGSDWDTAAAENGCTWHVAPPLALDPDQLGAIFPANRVRTDRFGDRTTVTGLGIPLVSWIDESSPLYPSFSRPPPSGVTNEATAVLRFDLGKLPAWELACPSLVHSVRMKGATHPLAMDLSAAHALYGQMSEMDKHKLSDVLRPDRQRATARLIFTQPPNPDRIPLILVHGFYSSPDAFAAMLSHLLAEPWFRDRYQVWIFSYSTGVPWMLSAARFREEFRAAVTEARHAGVRHLDRCVIIGHSMGGLITHASLKDPGLKMYANFATKPLDQLDLPAEDRKSIEEVFLWQPLAGVSRALFIATPHHGSPMADTYYSAIGSWLIRLPESLTVGLTELIERNATEAGDPFSSNLLDRLFFKRGKSYRAPTVIESLSPNRPTIRTLHALKFPEKVILHSIIGDRGRGETVGGSDGVVPYWSSHLDESASEAIVPADHAAVEHPQTVAEVKRILRLHLQNVPE